MGTFWISSGIGSTFGGWHLVDGFKHEQHTAILDGVESFGWNCNGTSGKDSFNGYKKVGS